MIGDEMPVCPVCGDEVNEFYFSSETQEVVGCAHCVRPTDAWEYAEAQALSKEIERYMDRERDRENEGR